VEEARVGDGAVEPLGPIAAGQVEAVARENP